MDEEQFILEATYTILTELIEAIQALGKVDVTEARIGVGLPSKEIAAGVLAQLLEATARLRLRLKIDMVELPEGNVFEFTFRH